MTYPQYDPEDAPGVIGAPVEMLPCPFCGSDDVGEEPISLKGWTVVHDDGSADENIPISGWVIVCNECGSEGPADMNLSDAMDKWNTRANQEAT